MRKLNLGQKTIFSLALNFSYAVGNCIMGFVLHSWWFLTLGIYYTTLSVMRFSVLQINRRQVNDDNGQFAKKYTGIFLVLLAVDLVGVVILSVVESRGAKMHEIVVITIALYAFTKITLSIINLVKSRHNNNAVIKTLRNISFADALASIYSLQRTMLASFPGLNEGEIKIFNILTGSAVCLSVLLLGINLIGGRKTQLAKSKIVKASEKIAETVVDGYKKIEKGVVDGYTKIEDKFVDAYLTKDGETVEEAKARLKKENK